MVRAAQPEVTSTERAPAPELSATERAFLDRPACPEGWEQRVEAAARAMAPAWGHDWDRILPSLADDYRRLAAAALSADSLQPSPAGREDEDECSATCRRQACEWCPGQDRFEATAQWLYTAVIARQDKVPSSDVTPWSDLTKDQRNGWRSWATELLALIDGEPAR